jgi:7-cyano-7-deazaguanine reductase
VSKPRSDILKTVENAERDRDYAITHWTDEFTFLYPITDQPCFASIEIEYHPAKHCIEMMSLKNYLQTFRDEAFYYEAVANKVLDDLADTIKPRRMKVTASFTVRGGISSTVKASVGDV